MLVSKEEGESIFFLNMLIIYCKINGYIGQKASSLR